MKKTLSILLVTALFLCTLTSCAGQGSVKVNGTKIEKGICLYLREEAKRANKDASPEELKEATNHEIAQYVAINSAFSEKGLHLTPAQKQKLPQTVNALWNLFGNYYKSIGVTKQDITAVETMKEAKNAVMMHYYSADGEEPIAEENLKAYFNENYIAFRYITGFSTTVDDNGNSVSLSDAEKEKMMQTFSNAASEINGGEPIETVARQLPNVNSDTEIAIRFKGKDENQQAFFQKVKEIEVGKAEAFSLGDYVFIILREDIEDENANYYAQYRTDCLSTLHGEDFQKIVDSWTEQYHVE